MERESSSSARKAAAGLAVIVLGACAVAMTVNAGEAVRARSSPRQTRSAQQPYIFSMYMDRHCDL